MSQSLVPPDLTGYAEVFAVPRGGRGLALRCLGGAAAAAAIVGVFVPVWPTTPFALVAAWAFARASPRLEARLLADPRLGPLIRNWRERGAIPVRAKLAAALSLPASWAGLWLAGAGPTALAASGAALGAVGLWVLSRPA